MGKARELTEAWGGKLYFVYLPALARYARGKEGDDEYFWRNKVLTTVQKQEIPIIDFNQWLVQQTDPLSFFPFKVAPHYTVDGYGMLAEFIQKRLVQDGVFFSTKDLALDHGTLLERS